MPATGFTFVTLVNDIKTRFTAREFDQAVLARKVQKMIGRPSIRTFLNVVERNLLPNCPVTRQDILNGEMIFGPDIGSLKGKTVRRKGEHVKVVVTELPADLKPTIIDATLCCDIMFVNKIPFLPTTVHSSDPAVSSTIGLDR